MFVYQTNKNPAQIYIDRRKNKNECMNIYVAKIITPLLTAFAQNHNNVTAKHAVLIHKIRVVLTDLMAYRVSCQFDHNNY